MILFDHDKLLNAMIKSGCFPVTSSVLLTRVFTPHTNILSDLNCTALSAPADGPLLCLRSLFRGSRFVFDSARAASTYGGY